MDRTRLRVHLWAAVFPAVVWLPPSSRPEPGLDSSGSNEPGQSVGKLANTGAKENKISCNSSTQRDTWTPRLLFIWQVVF